MAESVPVLVVDNGGSTIKCGLVRPGRAAASAPEGSGGGGGGGDGSATGAAEAASNGVAALASSGGGKPVAQVGKPRVIPNVIARTKRRRVYIADQVTSAHDASTLYLSRPIARGMVTDWNTQVRIWERALVPVISAGEGEGDLDDYAKHAALLATHAPFTPEVVRAESAEVAFELLGFRSLLQTTPSYLAVYDTKPDARLTLQSVGAAPTTAVPPATLVVDSGFSFTHVTPFFDGLPLNYGVRRVDVGGKALTNHLKELVSYRQLNMMDEHFVVDDIKHACCAVSQDYDALIAALSVDRKRRSEVTLTYVLPDYATTQRGYVLSPNKRAKLEGGGTSAAGSAEAAAADPPLHEDQMVRMGNERYAVPELLFNPQDIGLDQAGVHLAAAAAIEACHSDLHPFLDANVILTGGNTLIPGFVERFEAELRALVPQVNTLNVRRAEDPILAAWQGGARLAADEEAFAARAVTQEEYHEFGPALLRARFWA